MTQLRNMQVRLASRPHGMPSRENFDITETEETAEPIHGLRLRTLWLSIDPYMRARMSSRPSYTEPTRLGDVMPGGTVSQVVASSRSDYREGDFVLGYTGWQAYAHSDGQNLRKLDPAIAPVSTALGILGMPGMTAYTGLLNIGQPKPGETLVVAAAAGAVGSVVGQIAKLKGCRVVGIAGGKLKAEYVKEQLGFDDAIDHSSEEFANDLTRACPNGIDIYFENVGGKVWNAVYPLLNPFARIPVCGVISNYNEDGGIGGKQSDEDLIRQVLFKRLRIQGYIVTDFSSQEQEFLRDASAWFTQGKLKYKEHVVEGLSKAPEALIGLLRGENFGKLLVKVAAPI
jgi:NADPH-dependent curcumin reductase CurA